MKSCCPLCFCLAERRHSQYTRVVADLPCAGFRIQLILHVRRFFCDNVGCIRKIFTERLPAFVLPWARLTVRLCEALQSVGLATCGELGTRLAERLAIQTSPTTILRRLMTLPTGAVKRVVELGSDDFAFRRGRKFGTILVDMQSHQTIGLLPDRKKETASAWMSMHPEIKAGRVGIVAATLPLQPPVALLPPSSAQTVSMCLKILERLWRQY
jgi:transposase